MASTTWVGGDSGNETDWNTGANWSTGSIPTTNAHVVIANTGHNCALDTTRTIGSLTIQAGATIVGGGNKLIIQSEGDASGGTEHYALKNDGIVSGNLHLEFTYAGETAADFNGSSGNFNDIKLNAASVDLNQVGVATFDSLIIVANATYDAGNDGLTISGAVSCSGIFLGNSTTTISHGSLTVNSGGTYSATSGTTTITSEAGTGYAIELSGTYTHNSGILKITTDANTFLKPNDKVNHLIIEPATSTRVYEYVNNATIQGDLTINAGRLAHYSSTYSLDVNGDCTVNNTGILDGGSGSIELGSLTIASGGEYRATSGTTTITSESSGGNAINIDGSFVHNKGTVKIDHDTSTNLDIIGTTGVDLYDLIVDSDGTVGYNTSVIENNLTKLGSGLMRPTGDTGRNLTVKGTFLVQAGSFGRGANDTNTNTFGNIVVEGGELILTGGGGSGKTIVNGVFRNVGGTITSH